MFESEDDQNGTQPNEQSTMAAKIANMFRVPQASGQGSGDFVNKNLLRVDPATGVAYRFRPGLIGSSASGQDGQNGQTTAGQGGQSSTYVPPIQTRDAQGKTLPKYRMGIGHRILATVANFANGFAGNHVPPIYVGPGALNNRYYQDEAYRQQQNDEGQQNARDRYRNAIDWRTIGQDPTTKKWYGKTYGGQKQEVGTPPWAAPEDDNHESGDPENGDSANQVPGPLGVKSIQNAGQLFIPTASRQLPKSALAKPAIAPSGSQRNPDSYPLTARHKVTNQRIGSNDGQTWENLDSPGSSFA